MDPEKKYQLTILFDQIQIDISQLLSSTQKILGNDVTLRVGLSDNNDLILTIEGSLESVDKSHVQISKHLIEERQLNFFRLKDSAGDEIRRQAYPILSTIEQELRSFINRCLIDAFGFSWWASLGEITLPGISATFHQSGHHPLELMTIEQLIGFITFEKAEWEENNPVPLKDLLGLLSKSKSFEDFQLNLEKKARRISLWDGVFSKYFSVNQDEWRGIKNKDLEFIVNLRNRVMHHRPVHLGELTALEEKRKKIIGIVTSAKSQLSQEEKIEIAKLSKEIRDIYAEIVYEYSEKNAFTTIFQGLRKAQNPSIIRKLMSEAETFRSSGVITEKEILELKVSGFRQLRDITNNQIDQTQSIILDELLPLCLMDSSDSTDLRIQYRSFRELLTEWIEQHKQEDLDYLRNEILTTLTPLIGGEKHKPTCWLISTMGYGRPDIFDALWNFTVRSNDEAGDISLSTLTWLNIPAENRATILEALHQRAEKRFNNYLVFAIARLRDSGSIPIIINNWLAHGIRENKNVDGSLAFTAIREILDTHDNDFALQDEIWLQTTSIVETEPNKLYWDFDIGHIPVSCNSSAVIPTLMSWFGEHKDWFKNPERARYLAEERVADCIKPRQLNGWSQIENKGIFELLRNDALQNTKNDNFYTSQETLVKENAWRTLLRAGYEDSLNWFDQAVADEDGRFVKQKVMTYLACFRYEPLPRKIIDWIVDIYDDPGTGDGRELSYRMAAVRLARSASTVEAFEILLNFGYTYKGKVLTQLTDALAETAVDLLRHGNHEVVDRLAKLIIESPTEHQRMVCAQAIEIIAGFPEFKNYLLPYADAFVPLLNDESRGIIERGLLLSTLGHLREWPIPYQLLQDLIIWAHQPNEWIGGGSLQLLAGHGYLENDPNLMDELLGLAKEGDGSYKISEDMHFDWFPYIIGILYNQNPGSFSPVVISILSDPEWQSVVQIIRWLAITHSNQQPINLPVGIAETLIKRVEQFSPFYAETDLFDTLLKLAPNILIEFPLRQAVENWMPDSRVALANALGKLETNQDQKRQCLANLELLAEDNLFPVRRAAYRGISKQSSSYLYALCQSWSESPIYSLTHRAAEACGWIEGIKTIEGQDGFDDLYLMFANHPERKIREAAKRSWEERRKRIWARDYMERVLQVRGINNREILQAWCYGDALSLVGDDECRDFLIEHLSKKPLPPNVRHWVKRILDLLNDNWKKVTQKWPDPWTEMSGAIERGEGKFNNRNDPLVDIQYSIWFSPATKPNEKHSWGGVMLIPTLAEFIDVGSGEIKTKDGRSGTIIISRLQGNTVTFHGNGPFPEL